MAGWRYTCLLYTSAQAVEAGIKPDLIIGDLDSYKGDIPKDVPIEKLPVEKDDTDTGHSPVSYTHLKGEQTA